MQRIGSTTPCKHVYHDVGSSRSRIDGHCDIIRITTQNDLHLHLHCDIGPSTTCDDVQCDVGPITSRNDVHGDVRSSSSIDDVHCDVTPNAEHFSCVEPTVDDFDSVDPSKQDFA